jgi:sphingomyelin phosphodiesterase
VRYIALLDRFQHIIRFSVYGHVHHEHFGTVRGFNTGNPVGINYWAGSVSTWVSINPSFRVFEVDVETLVPVKAHTYVLNIQDENPEWKWDHEMTELYGMADLSPSSFSQLSDRLLQDEQLAILYMNT